MITTLKYRICSVIATLHIVGISKQAISKIDNELANMIMEILKKRLEI